MQQRATGWPSLDQGPVDGFEKRLGREWLDQAMGGSFHGETTRTQILVSGDENRLDRASQRQEMAMELDAGHPGELDIQHQALCARRRAAREERLCRAEHLGHE